MKTILIIAGIVIGMIAIYIWLSSSSSSGTGSGQSATSGSTAPRSVSSVYQEARAVSARNASVSTPSRRASPPLPPRSLSNPAPKYVPPRRTPPLPRNRVSVNPRIYDYPKCPACRKRNVRGNPQQVFWEASKKRFRCTLGHYFTGKEV